MGVRVRTRVRVRTYTRHVHAQPRGDRDPGSSSLGMAYMDGSAGSDIGAEMMEPMVDFWGKESKLGMRSSCYEVLGSGESHAFLICIPFPQVWSCPRSGRRFSGPSLKMIWILT